MNRHVQAAIDRGEVVPKVWLDSEKDRSDLYARHLGEANNRIGELAKDHSVAKISRSNIQGSKDGEQLWCPKCATPWPCATFRWATGRDFAPLKLTMREVPE